MNVKSLELCRGFPSTVEVSTFDGETHSGLLDSSDLQAKVISVATIGKDGASRA